MNNEIKLGIQENNKIVTPKSIVISGEVHDSMKTYCKQNGLKISGLVEKLYLDLLNKKNNE